MNECNQKDQLALSVFDCNSKDVQDLKTEIEMVWKGRLVFHSEDRVFTRAYTFSQAVCQSEGSKVFICDADMTLPFDFVELYNKFVNKKTVWFPICFSLFSGKKREIEFGNGWWRGEGHGIIGILKVNYESLGGFDLGFSNWGGEDDDFFVRAHVNFKVIRKKCIGLFHNWHPPSKKWGGRGVDGKLPDLTKDYHKSTKDITLRSREILFTYIYKLIRSGGGCEARKILMKKYLFARYKVWWKIWFDSLMIK
jgi:hypothetical protein